MASHPLDVFKSTCSYCGVGCGIEILKDRGGRLQLRGDESHPANRGMLCAKGRSLLHTVQATDTRLRYPFIRTSRESERQRVSWDEAMAHVADRFKRIIAERGPDAVAFYVSGQCLTEEYYLVNKIAKGFIGTNNIDTNSRLCMSSAVAGYKATLGADAPPISYEDIDCCDTFFIAGANPAWCHPILFRRIEARKAADPSVKVVVIDPRRTASCAIADLHLAIRPGTDVALFLGIAHQLWRTGQFDQDFISRHTLGFVEYVQSLAPWTLSRTAEVCGVAEQDVALAAEYLSGSRRFLSLWTMGLNQSAAGTDKNIALISLSLATGKIGRLGCGPFSLTGQPNAMGGREVGGMANLLPAHRNLADPRHRHEVAEFWGVPADRIAPKPGLTAVELFDAVAAGRVKAVWVIATNPAASLPNAWRVDQALSRAELVVAQDIYPTETTDCADVILPAAGWMEKTGAMTNSDRRISLLEKVIDPPGEALADTEILLRFARAMGWGDAFNYAAVADIFGEHAALTRGTDIDIGGLSHATLRDHGTMQWPVPQKQSLGTLRLYTDHVFATPDGRARLLPVQFENRSEPLSPEFPLILTTGRIRDHWHTMTKTGQVHKLSAHIDSPFCEIHPEDATERGICEGDVVVVSSARGSVQVRAVVTPEIRRGVIFLPMHWGKRLGGARGRANNLTSPRLDPTSKEPDLKFAAAQVVRFAPAKRRIAIIGGGAACVAFIEHHRGFNLDDDITVFSAEPEPIYNRVLLPHYMDGSRPFSSLVRADQDFFTRQNVAYHRATAIERVNAEAKTLTDHLGRTHAYDLLILATGSRPAIHYDGPLPETGVFTLRSRRDADSILAASARANHAVIVGGGLLGLELADALRTLGNHVAILQRSDRLMGKQLDAVAATHLAENMRDLGVQIQFDAALEEVVGDQQVTAVRYLNRVTGQEESLPCDLLVFATGIVANKELAGAAGLNCERGILIDEHLRTSHEGIFAIGECAQLGEQTFGTTPAAEQQARALAEFLRGNLHAPYRGTVGANILKVHGVQLASAGIIEFASDDRRSGDLPPESEVEILTLHDPAQRYYQKLLIHRDRLIGAICMGDTSRFSEYLDLIATGMELDDKRATLLRPGVAAAPLDGALVCSCNYVGENTIRNAAASCGGNLQRVCAATRAGTSCGSCKPEIQKLIQQVTIHAVTRPAYSTPG